MSTLHAAVPSTSDVGFFSLMPQVILALIASEWLSLRDCVCLQRVCRYLRLQQHWGRVVAYRGDPRRVLTGTGTEEGDRDANKSAGKSKSKTKKTKKTKTKSVEVSASERAVIGEPEEEYGSCFYKYWWSCFVDLTPKYGVLDLSE